MATIDPCKKYTLKEIMEEKLIPTVKSYASLYNLVTEQVYGEGQLLNGKQRKTFQQRRLRTDDNRLYAIVEKVPLNKIVRYLVKGSDITEYNERKRRQRLGLQ